MELFDLIGRHRLTGFDRDIPDSKSEDNYGSLVNGICFVLDDKKYQLYEDLADGYRSYLSSVFEEQNVKCKNMFNAIEVIIAKVPNTVAENTEAIVMYSAKTGKEILTIGTFDYNDYYPYCKSYLDVKQLNKEIRG